MKKPFRFPKEPVDKPVLARIKPSIGENTLETLTGVVNGMQAAKAEERCARSLDRLGLQYEFRFGAGGRGMPGWKELDFLVYRFGKYYPANLVEKSFIHKGKESQDALNEVIIMNFLRRRHYNPQPFQRWDNIHFETQEMSDKFIAQIFFG